MKIGPAFLFASGPPWAGRAGPSDPFDAIGNRIQRIPIQSYIKIALSLYVSLAQLGCGPAPVSPAPPPKPSGTVPKESPKTLRVSPEAIDGKKWLITDSAKAVAAGAGALSVLGANIGSEGDRVGSFIEIPEKECALILARGSPTIADVDLFAYEDDGSLFASDEAADSAATLLICPPHPERLYTMARIMSGSGFLSVGLHSVTPARADAAAKATNARGRPGQDSGRLDSWPGLEAKIRAHRQHVGSRWEEVRRIALPVGSRAPSRVSLSTDAGRCLDVLAVPSEEVAALDAVVENEEGRIVARAREQEGERWIVLCTADASELSFSVRPRTSEGLVAVVIARSAIGAQAEVAQSAVVEHASQSLDVQGARKWLSAKFAGQENYGPARLSGTGAARTGSRSTMTLDLSAGCNRIDVIAGAPLVDMLAELWTDKNALWAEARGGAVASLFACGSGGSARLDVEAMGRPGPFAVEVRKDKNAPSSLIAAPVAAARLLARMNAGGPPADAGQAEKAISLSLESASLKKLPLLAAPNTCVEVIAALDTMDGAASGVDVRIVDLAGKELSLSRARFVTASRVCADAKAPASGIAEFRSGGAKTNALVLTRSLPSP